MRHQLIQLIDQPLKNIPLLQEPRERGARARAGVVQDDLLVLLVALDPLVHVAVVARRVQGAPGAGDDRVAVLAVVELRDEVGDRAVFFVDEAQLEAAVELLLNADNIYVAGVRRMFPIASYIAYALQHTAKKVHLLSGLGGMFPQQIRSIGEKDVLIAISFQPYGKESRYCARVAAQHKAKQLVITDSQLSPLARGADAVALSRETLNNLLPQVKRPAIILAGNFHEAGNAPGIPPGRGDAIVAIGALLEAVKADGTMARIFAASGLAHLEVAPAGSMP